MTTEQELRSGRPAEAYRIPLGLRRPTAEVTTEFHIDAPGIWGSPAFEVDRLKEFEADPWAFLARHFGVSVTEYLAYCEFHEDNATSRCGRPCVDGRPCQAVVFRDDYISPRAWLKRRDEPCWLHARQPGGDT